jgi:hypothetical protein
MKRNKEVEKEDIGRFHISATKTNLFFRDTTWLGGGFYDREDIVRITGVEPEYILDENIRKLIYNKFITRKSFLNFTIVTFDNRGFQMKTHPSYVFIFFGNKCVYAN